MGLKWSGDMNITIEVGPHLFVILQGAGTLIILALIIWAFFKD
jgi:hypothetical protein